MATKLPLLQQTLIELKLREKLYAHHVFESIKQLDIQSNYFSMDPEKKIQTYTTGITNTIRQKLVSVCNHI